MNKGLAVFLIVLAVALVGVSQSLFVVDQSAQAIVLQLGQPVGDPANESSFIRGPGLHVKIPLVQDVRVFDRRILSVDPPPEQVVIASASSHRFDAPAPKPAGDGPENILEAPAISNVSGEPIIVDTFARYKITDPLRFLKTLRTQDNATLRLQSILNDATRAILGETTLQELLSADRVKVMNEIRARVNRKIEQDSLGIQIVDVRIVRADLTSELRTSTVRRMISELKERATETRAKGEEEGLKIRSTADKDRSILLAEAQRGAQGLKGQGDKEAIVIYASAFNKDKEFYSFIRSMEAYKNTFANPETQMILSPDSDFFRYFGQQSGGVR